MVTKAHAPCISEGRVGVCLMKASHEWVDGHYHFTSLCVCTATLDD